MNPLAKTNNQTILIIQLCEGNVVKGFGRGGLVVFSTASVYQILRFSRNGRFGGGIDKSDLVGFSRVLTMNNMPDAKQDGWKSRARLRANVSGWVMVSEKIKENCLLA